MRDIWQRQGFVQALLALLTACVLASHNTGPIGASTSPALGYAYWIARIGLQAMAICAASALLYYAIPAFNSRPMLLAVFSALVSHPFFVTMVTMMDLFIGFPEFDPVEWERSLSSRFPAQAGNSLPARQSDFTGSCSPPAENLDTSQQSTSE